MIKAEVRYTTKHIRKFLWSGRNLIAMIFLYTIYAANLVMTGLLLLAKLFGADVDLTFEIVLMLFFSAYLVYRTFFYEKTYLKRYQHQFPNTAIDFSFGENCFTINGSGEAYNSHQEIDYGKLLKAVEKNEWFMLYITSVSVYVINKSEITEGTPDELRELLKRKLGNKFRR